MRRASAFPSTAARYRFWEGGDSRVRARCGERKPLDAFGGWQRGRPKSYCKTCALQVTQEWRARHHDELLARRRASYSPTTRWVCQLRRRAWAMEREEDG
jgi:hypothetical protein